MKLFNIPNLFTLGNLLCGCLAIVFAFEGNLVWTAYLVGIACVLDFLDGFLARALKQYSEIGKQLDSLADMVSFGVVPGVVVFIMVSKSLDLSKGGFDFLEHNKWVLFFPFIISLFSALRLAKFNIDTRQSDSFIGVPTPACSIFFCSIPLIVNWTDKFSYVQYPDYFFLVNPYFLLGTSFIMSILLISEIPLFALKFKNYGWKGNEIRWSFLVLSILLLGTLQYVGIPLTIVLYILMSVGNNLVKKKK